jgi:hypothetical protein
MQASTPSLPVDQVSRSTARGVASTSPGDAAQQLTITITAAEWVNLAEALPRAAAELRSAARIYEARFGDAGADAVKDCRALSERLMGLDAMLFERLRFFSKIEG